MAETVAVAVAEDEDLVGGWFGKTQIYYSSKTHAF